MLIMLARIVSDIVRQALVVLVSSVTGQRIFIEHGDHGEPDLKQLLEQLIPAELVLVERFKSYPIEKN